MHQIASVINQTAAVDTTDELPDPESVMYDASSS